jgi:hypothetical protein
MRRGERRTQGFTCFSAGASAKSSRNPHWAEADPEAFMPLYANDSHPRAQSFAALMPDEPASARWINRSKP